MLKSSQIYEKIKHKTTLNTNNNKHYINYLLTILQPKTTLLSRTPQAERPPQTHPQTQPTPTHLKNIYELPSHHIFAIN